MPRQRYERLLLEKMHASQRWENEPADRITVADLDANEIRRTIDEAVRRNRLEDPGTRDVSELLAGLGLLYSSNSFQNCSSREIWTGPIFELPSNSRVPCGD